MKKMGNTCVLLPSLQHGKVSGKWRTVSPFFHKTSINAHRTVGHSRTSLLNVHVGCMIIMPCFVMSRPAPAPEQKAIASRTGSDIHPMHRILQQTCSRGRYYFRPLFEVATTSSLKSFDFIASFRRQRQDRGEGKGKAEEEQGSTCRRQEGLPKASQEEEVRPHVRLRPGKGV